MKLLVLLALALSVVVYLIGFSSPPQEDFGKSGVSSNINFNSEIHQDIQNPKSLASAFQTILEKQTKVESPNNPTNAKERLSKVFGPSRLGQELASNFEKYEEMIPERVISILREDPSQSMDIIINALDEIALNNDQQLKTTLLEMSTYIPEEDDKKLILWKKEVSRPNLAWEDRVKIYKQSLKNFRTPDQIREIQNDLIRSSPDPVTRENIKIEIQAIEPKGNSAGQSISEVNAP